MANRRRILLLLAVALIVAVIALAQFLYGVPVAKMPVARDGTIEIHAIDVGQADCTLIRWADGAILIDAGDEATEKDVLKYLRFAGVERLDCAIFTHPDSDHIGGADGLLKALDVGCVIIPSIPEDHAPQTETYVAFLTALFETCAEVVEMKAGDSLQVGALSIRVLAPQSAVYDEINDYSLVLRIDFGETSFLFTGDATEIVEQELLGNCAFEDLDCDFFQAGHHGSSTSNTEAFVQVVSPEIVVISCGENSFGHPSGEALLAFREAGAEVLRTDRDGTVVLVSDGEKITIK